jgi:hypothetical protein
MKNLFIFMLTGLILANCGRNLSHFENTDGYTVQEDLAVTGSISLAYRKAYRLRGSFPSVDEQTEKCLALASDYNSQTGQSLAAESLKVLLAGPEKNCLHRNVLNGCDKYEYIYTTTCRFQVVTP